MAKENKRSALKIGVVLDLEVAGVGAAAQRLLQRRLLAVVADAPGQEVRAGWIVAGWRRHCYHSPQ